MPEHELKLTSVLNMSEDFTTIRRTIAALVAQGVRQNLEVIIIATSAGAKTIDRAEMSRFGAFQVIEVDSLPSGAYGWAEGFRRARAPVVVISEDHGFPAPNWAQTLIEAHASGDYFAVCPAIENGNPQTCTSWANFVLSFIEWYRPEAPHLVVAGAGHNTSYNRAALLADYGSALDRWLNPERVLHFDLNARGKKILLESRTSVAHVNVSLFGAYFGISYSGGRVFGAARAAKWSIFRRGVFAALFWLVPFVRLRRLLAAFNTTEKRRGAKLVRTMPLIIAGLFCHAFGEAVGYVFGAGRIVEKYTTYELRRRDFVTARERAWMLSVPSVAAATFRRCARACGTRRSASS